MPDETCLFSAPFDFIRGLPETVAGRPLILREIWTRDELGADDSVVGWVCNPGQSFVIGDDDLRRFPNLRVLVTASTGNNHVDRQACERAGVMFRSLLDDRPALENIAASAEFTFFLLLDTLKRLPFALNEVAEGRWRHNEDQMRGHELQGRTVGICGLGRIGRRVWRYCEAFGASVQYYDPYVERDDVRRAGTLGQLFSTSDSVVISCSLTDETRGMIDGKLLAQMRPEATLVNTARGEVVDEEALVRVCLSRPDVHVGVDVVWGEVTGTQFEAPLLKAKLPNVVIAPHIAGATIESQSKAARIAVGQIETVLSGVTS